MIGDSLVVFFLCRNISSAGLPWPPEALIALALSRAESDTLFLVLWGSVQRSGILIFADVQRGY